MEKEKNAPQKKPATQRRTVLIIGILVLLFSIYLLVFLVPDFLRSAVGAENMTLERAAEVATAESVYASIEDGVWDCDTIEYIRGRSASNSSAITTRFTEIFYTDKSTSAEIVMLAQMSGEMTCLDFDDLTPTGYLTRMSEDKQQDLINDARLARYFDATSFLEFCGYCGAENSLIGVVVGAILAVIGLVTLIFGFRMPKPDASVEPPEFE